MLAGSGTRKGNNKGKRTGISSLYSHQDRGKDNTEDADGGSKGQKTEKNAGLAFNLWQGFCIKKYMKTAAELDFLRWN